MKDDRAVKNQKIIAYADAMLMYAISIGGKEEALEVRADLRQIILACMYNANMLNAFSKDASERYSNTLKDLDIVRFVNESFKGARKPVIFAITLMAENQEAYLLPSLADKYDELLEGMYDTVIVDVITSVKLDDNLRKKIRKKAQRDLLTSQILLDEHISKKILGGFILIAKGRVLDMSVSSLLRKTKNELTSIHQKV